VPPRGGLLVRDGRPRVLRAGQLHGFALQEKTLPFETAEESGEVVQQQAETVGAESAEYPYLIEVATNLPQSGYDYAVEFEWGLDLILDRLEQLRSTG
jgi:hypothetical protein